MFENLTQRLTNSFRKITNVGRLTDNNIKNTIRDIRTALLEADVTLSVIKLFIENIQKKSIGNKINKSLTPGQEFIKIVKHELILVLGDENKLNLSINPPAVILVVGLQGSGKTTSLAKLAYWIKNKYRKKILMTSTDIYRAAAIKQLKILSNEVKIDFFSLHEEKTSIEITQKSIQYAKKNLYDILLIDTAGRLHVDQDMMYEIHQIQHMSKPIETLLIVDSMTGQDAINIAKIFNKNILISGIILTKTDSDSRSGVALSMRYITGKPIKFIGIGEKIKDLEKFNPKKIADRILGMNNVISLIKEIENKIDQSHIQKLKKKIHTGYNFDLNDFLIQIQQMQKIGGLNNFISKISYGNQLFNHLSLLNNKKNIFKKIEAIIYSMTIKERIKPEIIKGSRKRRIALGSGTKIQDVNQLLKNFDNIQKIMKKIKTGGMAKIIRRIKNIIPNNSKK